MVTNDIAALRDSRHLPGMSAYSHSPWFLLIVLALSVGQAVAQPTVGVPYQPDAEPDGLIGASDLLSLLGLFGTVYTPDEVTVDGVPLATAWQEECEEEEAYADLDGAPEGAVAVFYDGQWVLLEDNALDCAIGFGCTDPAYLEFDSLAVIDDGTCTVHVDSTCVSPTFDGYTYAVVEIGDQCWFAENLRTAVYANGDSIPGSLSGAEWSEVTVGASAISGEGNSLCIDASPDVDACDEVAALAAYGRQYNWPAVDDPRGLCPTGWHVPTDGEWTELEAHVAGLGYAGSEGVALKTTSGWYSNFGTDAVGFGGLPGGFRRPDNGYYDSAGYLGMWWTSTPSGDLAWGRILSYFDIEIDRPEWDRGIGNSVRCLRDLD